MPEQWDSILNKISKMPGKTSLYYQNLVTGRVFYYQPDLPLIAASVIKLPIMLEAFRQIQNGLLMENTVIPISAVHKLPSCGVLSYLHSGLEVTLIDLITLMIIVSDNTATNILIDILGLNEINKTLASFDIFNSRLNRRLFEPELARLGIQNYITAGDMGRLLEAIYKEQAISQEASKKMLHILCCQQLNGKFPFYLHSLGIQIAHKTGEDDGITHDAGIIYAREPFILCMCANETDVPAFEHLMQETALMLVTLQQETDM